MVKSLTPSTLLEVSALCARAYVPPLIHGPSGIGKTSMIKALARSNSPEHKATRLKIWGSTEAVEFINVRAAQKEPTDFTGLPYISDVLRGEVYGGKEGVNDIDKEMSVGEAEISLTSREFRVTRFASPEDMPGNNPLLGPRGILCLDEFFRTTESTLQAMFELIEPYYDPLTGITRHKIGANELPPGWHVFALTNPMSSDNFVQNPFMDRALFNRFAHFWFGVDGTGDEYTSDWQSYMSRRMAEKYGELHPLVENVFSLVNTDSKFLFGKAAEETPSFGMAVAPCPAGWEKVFHIVYANRKVNASETALDAAIAGLVGAEAASRYKAENPPVRPTDILNVGRPAWKKVLIDEAGSIKSQTLSALVGVVSSMIPLIDGNQKDKRDLQRWNLCEFVYDVASNIMLQDRHGRKYEYRDILANMVHNMLVRDMDEGGWDVKNGKADIPLISLLETVLVTKYEDMVDLFESILPKNKGSWILTMNEVIKSRKDSDKNKKKVKDVVAKSIHGRVWLMNEIREAEKKESE